MKNKPLVRVILMTITFVTLAVSVLFAEALGETPTTVLRLVGIICGIISLGIYDKKLR